MSRSRQGFLLLDCLLGLTLLTVLSGMLHSSVLLKSRITMNHEEEEMIELWEDSAFREFWSPKEEAETPLLPSGE